MTATLCCQAEKSTQCGRMQQLASPARKKVLLMAPALEPYTASNAPCSPRSVSACGRQVTVKDLAQQVQADRGFSAT